MLPNECVRYRVQKINMRSEWRSSPTILRTSCVMVTLISSCVSCVYDEYVDEYIGTSTVLLAAVCDVCGQKSVVSCQ